MIISSGNVSMASSRRYQKEEAAYKNAAIWGSGGLSEATSYAGTKILEKSSEDSSSKGYESSYESTFADYLGSYTLKEVTSSGVTGQKTSIEEAIREIRQQAMDFMLRILFGDKWERYSKSCSVSAVDGFSSFVQQDGGALVSQSFTTESEVTKFSTEGTVITADGREINFNVNAVMSRSFTESEYTSIEYGTALKDPLVINLDSDIASVSDQYFYFDIDADGHEDAVRMLSAGSGFLALDKNGDGKIGDGRELFGALSGNGFDDLMAYDTDKNGWIDEADEVFDSLMIWQIDSEGNQVLTGLGSSGVGALYLGNVSTEFSLNSLQTNETGGVIRNSGMFLYENGNAGIIQQIDLAVK
ncbi:MAG: hypothetical protein K6G40_07060 [Eubacterium sp.]|nr:hypothetical protein [Eubacterium sp.]